MCCKDPVTTMFITLPALIGGQHIGRNPACASPANEASLLCSSCVGRLLSSVPSNVHVHGLACAHCVSMREGGRVCVWTGSVDCSSWKNPRAAENFVIAHNNKFLKSACD